MNGQPETPEDIRDFLNEVAQTGDETDFIHALNTAAKAMGMTEVAKKAGVTRASLYKSLSESICANQNSSVVILNCSGNNFGCRC